MSIKDRNRKHEESKSENRIRVLQAVLNTVSLEDLIAQLKKGPSPIERSTLFKYLGPMVKEELIEPIMDVIDRRNRCYKITSKGLELLNVLDAETHGKIFTALVFTELDSILKEWRFFDDRLPLKTFEELLEMFKQMDDAKNQGKFELNIQIYNNFSKIRDEELAKLEKINDTDVSLRDVFYDLLSSFISASVYYISIKFMEDRKVSTIYLLNNLSHLISTRLWIYHVPTAQIQKKNAVFWNLLDQHYYQSQTITVDTYKKIMDIYEKEADVLFMEAVGGEFKGKRYKKALQESMKNKRQ
jgi:DNA-binding MarR family transcriptional regulator